MNIEDILFNSPLYSKWKNVIQIEEDGELVDSTLNRQISNYNELIELYCLECNSKRMFAADKGIYDTGLVIPGHFGGGGKVKNKPSLFKSFSCSASSDHRRMYGFHVDGENLIKISEYPTKYDSVKYKFNKYEKLLGKQKIKELGKAAQLESFGYPIAAFLFYRRLFETIIFNIFHLKKIENKMDEDDFRKLRMKNKIDYIKDSLPQYFLENTFMYGVLSKGIHELEEKECEEYLEVVKTVIFFSLDEALDKRERENRKMEFANKLKDIKSKME